MNNKTKLGILFSLTSLLTAFPAVAAFYEEPEPTVVEDVQPVKKSKKKQKKQINPDEENMTVDTPVRRSSQVYVNPYQGYQQPYGYPQQQYQPYPQQGYYQPQPTGFRPIVQWQIWKGEKLSDVFTRWARETGRWRLVYEAPDRVIDNDLTLNCAFEDAIEQILEVLNADGEYLIAKFYHGNNTIRIQEAD